MLLRSLGVALFATFVAAAPAAAATITFQDIFDPVLTVGMAEGAAACTGTNGVVDTVAPVEGGPCGTLSFNQVLAGYSNALNVLESATLTLYMHDDGGPGDGTEKFTLTADLTTLFTEGPIPGSGNPTGPVSVFAEVMGDGILSVLLTAAVGDFRFDRAILDASWSDRVVPPTPVPEPASLLLLGAGAIAVAHRVRKAKRS